MLETLKLIITKRWLQNEKDHSKSRRSWDHSHTSWSYQTLGGFITSSMQLSLCRIRKRTYTDPISSDLLRISRTMKNDTKWKQFSDTKNESEDIDTMSNGKDIRLRKHRGNQQRVLMAVAKKSLTSISAVITSKPPSHEPRTQATIHTTTAPSSTCRSKFTNSQKRSRLADSSEKSPPYSMNPLPPPPRPLCHHTLCSRFLVI